MSIALGVDLFDSAAYAIFARDGRILTPEGTVKLEEISEWPFPSNSLHGHTPEQVNSMDLQERSEILARHNLEITQSELAKCREAVRKGTIWELAEQRSHSSPYLREAFVWLQDQLDIPDEGPVGDSVLRLIASTDPLRQGGESLGDDIEYRPHILHMQALLAMRWRFPGSWWDSSGGDPDRVVLIEGTPPPWRITSMESVISLLIENPKTVILISTPIGPIPFSLEDVSPWCHLNGPEAIWHAVPDDEEITDSIDELGLSGIPVTRYSPEELYDNDPDKGSIIREWMDR